MDDKRYDASVADAANTLGKRAGQVAGTVRQGVDVGLRKTRSYAQDMKLFQAVRKGNLGKTREALRLGADPDICMGVTGPSKARDGKPALAQALVGNYYAVAEALIDAGAQVNRGMGNPQGLTLIEYLSTQGRVDEKQEKDLLRVAEKLMENGANVQYRSRARGNEPTFLHRLARRCTRPELAKLAMLHGAPVDVADADGKTPEMLLDRSLPKPFQRHMDAMEGALRQHRLAPCPDIDETLSYADLTTAADNGHSALDHWHTWDNYRSVQDGLKAQGDRLLSASDLLQPLGGESGAPTRLEAMLQTCPKLAGQLFDADLWKGEGVETAKAFYEKLSPDMQKAAPYHSLRIKLQSEQQRGDVRGR